MTLRRVQDAAEDLRWLSTADPDGGFTGFDVDLWPASTWVLHAMYENRSLVGLGTHDEWHRRRVEAGDIAPPPHADTWEGHEFTFTGTTGFVARPDRDWQRLTWHDYLARAGGAGDDRRGAPSHHWFPQGSWPVAIEPPPEGSLDEESMTGLIDVLAAEAPRGLDTECFAFYAETVTGDYDAPHLWRAPLRSIPDLVAEMDGDEPYGATPSNFWPVDRTWFVWTDWDLQGTRVSGSERLVAAVEGSEVLECVRLPRAGIRR